MFLTSLLGRGLKTLIATTSPGRTLSSKRKGTHLAKLLLYLQHAFIAMCVLEAMLIHIYIYIPSTHFDQRLLL